MGPRHERMLIMAGKMNDGFAAFLAKQHGQKKKKKGVKGMKPGTPPPMVMPGTVAKKQSPKKRGFYA